MQKILFKNSIDWKLLLLSFAMIALFLHGKVPYMLYLSGISFLLVIGGVSAQFKNNKKDFLDSTVGYIKKTWLYLFVSVIFFLSVLLNTKGVSLLYKESLYALYIWLIVGLLHLLLKHDEKQYSLFTYYFEVGYIVLFLIVVFGLINNVSHESIRFGKLFGIRIDYNYLAYALISCFLIIVFLFRNAKNRWINILFTIYLIILVVSVLLSGSRRGLLVFGLIHVLLLVYLLWSYLKKSRHRILSYYFVFLISIFILSSILFYSGSAAFRSYFVERVFPENNQQVKSQYSQILYRYSSILNDSSSYRDQYKKDWLPLMFESKGWINNFMFYKTNRCFQEEYTDGLYDKAFGSLNELRNFSSSIEQFVNILPDEYKKVLTEEFIESDSFSFAPYLLPIPYIDKNFFSIRSVKNIYPIAPFNQHNLIPISFIKTRKGVTFISMYIPLIPNSKNEINIQYKGVKPEKLKIVLSKLKDKRVNIDDIVIGTMLQNGFYPVLIKFITDSDTKGLGVLKLQPEISLSDTFYIGDHTYSRMPEVKKSIVSNDKDFLNIYRRVQFERGKEINNYYQQYINEYKSLSKEEKDSLICFLDKSDQFEPNFRPYGAFSILFEETIDSKVFVSPDDKTWARCFSVIPCIPNTSNKIKLTIKSNKKPTIYLKRYPERSIYIFKKAETERKINESRQNVYEISVNYSIKESSSAIGALVLGIKDASKGEQFEVSDFSLKIQMKDSNFQFTPYQYSFLKPYIEKTLNETYVVAKTDSDMELFLDWKNNNQMNKNSLSDSRLHRWKFALFYYRNFSFKNKLFGKSFEYLKIYKTIFSSELYKDVEVDYPHNPIISAFLYSGILGGLLYIVFLVQIFYRYWCLRKKITLFGILYLLVLSFTFFSGNSHFSVPAFTLLSLIPFAYNIKKTNVEIKTKE